MKITSCRKKGIHTKIYRIHFMNKYQAYMYIKLATKIAFALRSIPSI